MKRKTNFGRDAYAPPELYVVVLAAGMGTRLKPHTDAVPKALLRLDDGEPLLSRTLAGLTTRPEVAEVIVVGGHRYDVLRSYLSTLDAPPPCRTVFNPDFAVKGPIESLRRSLKLVPRGGTVAILNGDTWYGRAALGSLVER
ncbi:MAG: NTP transferase domain-containing protein, partial [Methylothermaceae bacterium]|nr:NTP transferase domain-containing protein [Methylothermaceae bacterium]